MSEKNNELFNQLITFSRKVTPKPIEVRVAGASDEKWIYWGVDNLYPNFLLELFNEVPLHKSISTTKVDYLMGDGLLLKGTNENADFQIGLVDSLEETVNKLVFDYVLFNFFAVEVQYNVMGKPIYFNHIPANHIRMNKPKTKFWVSDSWELQKEILSYDRFIAGKNEDGLSKIYLYAGYNPTVQNVYAAPKYNAAITSMVTEMLVNQFNKNNLEEGFSPSHIISFFKGVPSPEDARRFERSFAETFKGESGLKYIINYNNPNDTPIQVSSITGDDYAEKLVEVNKKIETNILTSHQATSRLLFGIETPGSLGNSSELEIAYQIFKKVWVQNNRNQVENGINKLFKDCGLPEIEFKDKGSLFSASLPDEAKLKVYTVNELRAIDNLQPIPSGDILIQSVAKGDAKNGEPVPEGTPNDSAVEGLAEEQPEPKKITSKKLTADDFEKVKHLGHHKGDFSILDSIDMSVSGQLSFKQIELMFDDAKDIEDYLLKNKINGKSLSDIKAGIRRDLGISVSTSDLADKIKAMTDAGILNSKIDGDTVSITPVKQDSPRTVQTMYEYQVRPGYGAPLIATSRDFCTKLIENDRYYTRADIQTMSEIFGYDVFTHCGGWYTNPDTGKAENQCRHQWVSQRVIRKK